MITSYIGLGSNIQPEENLKAAAELLRASFLNIRFSSVYKTAARDETDQPDFLNAVAEIQSDLSPEDIFATLKTIEQKRKKEVPFKAGPRTLDLDLLLYGDEVITTPELTIPHPRMHERRFVLEPFCELMERNEKHPVLLKTWGELLLGTQHQLCEPIDIKL